jgi:hypothetical protein
MMTSVTEESARRASSSEILRTDTINGADSPSQHVIQSPILSRAFNSENILGFLDNTNQCGVPLRIGAKTTGVIVRNHSADVTEPDLLPNCVEKLRKLCRVIALVLNDEEGNSLRRLRANAWKFPKFIDEVLDYPLIHS